MNMTEQKQAGDDYLAIQLVEAFDHLILSLNTFCDALKKLKPRIWLPLTEQEKELNINPIDKAVTYYKDLWYTDGQDGRETRSCFGIIGASEVLIEFAQAVNHRKQMFQQAVKAIQKNKPLWEHTSESINERHPQVRETLLFNRLARVHLKQCYRQIPMVPDKPNKVGFSWYKSGRSIKRITVEDAIASLENLDTSSKHIQTQLSLVSTYPLDMPLAKVQQLAPIMRANLVFPQLSPEGDVTNRRQAMNISLPLLIPLEVGEEFPSHNAPPLQPPEKRTRLDRSDILIEAEPFLPSIRVHRYAKETQIN